MKFLFPIAVLFPLLSMGQQQVSQQKIKNVAAFARLYGYVRYFHPSDEAAAINWEDFVYYGIREVQNEKTAAGLANKLDSLFKPIAPSVVISSRKRPQFSVKTITPPAAVETQDVFWQHFGLGLTNDTFKSLRVNRLTPIRRQQVEAASLSQRIDAMPYRGKRLKLRATMKIGGVATEGLLYIDIHNADRSGRFRNMNDHPATSTKWQEYEITDTIPAKAMSLYVGALVRGKGRAWVDNVILEIEENGEWKKVSLVNPSFEISASDVEGWSLKSQPDRFELVKLDAAAGKQALLLKNDEENGRMTFEQRPSFGDYVTKDLGSGISCIIPLVLKTAENQTYPSASQDRLQRLKDSIDALTPSDKTAIDPYVRLSGITIAWNIFKHFFPYHEEARTDWDAELNSALEQAYSIESAADYLPLLKHLTEKLKDGHVRVSRTVNLHSIPAIVTLAEGQIVIEKVAPENTQLKAGDIVTQINRKPALTMLAELKAEISGSEQWKNHRATAELFNGSFGSEIVLTIKRGREPEKHVWLSRGNYNLVDRYTPDIRKLNEDTYYVNLATTPMQAIERDAQNLLKAKALIFDLRGYPRENNQIIGHLLSAADTSKWMFIPQITRPDFEDVSYKATGWTLKPLQPHISAKVAFLTGGGAISQSESVMAYIKHHKLATIVGQPTAGANGDVNRFILPDNYSISFSGLKVRQHDGSQLHTIGIQPDVFVNRTIKGITEERDEYLEKALEILNTVK